ncbi:hypothetical protein V8E53_004547, partial [Lactarius tabidus]
MVQGHRSAQPNVEEVAHRYAFCHPECKCCWRARRILFARWRARGRGTWCRKGQAHGLTPRLLRAARASGRCRASNMFLCTSIQGAVPVTVTFLFILVFLLSSPQAPLRQARRVCL